MGRRARLRGASPGVCALRGCHAALGLGASCHRAVPLPRDRAAVAATL
jgi:hypothetical protein